MQLTKDKFNELCDDLFKGTLDIVDQALKLANMEAANIDHVVRIFLSLRSKIDRRN